MCVFVAFCQFMLKLYFIIIFISVYMWIIICVYSVHQLVVYNPFVDTENFVQVHL